jgi:hypothetical protein
VNAQKLARLLKDTYGFEVEEYVIPVDIVHWKFTTRVGGELQKVFKEPKSLFIMYYGGHATLERGYCKRKEICSSFTRSDHVN